MLVIVNPYATTVSDRLRNLVVYALQGRYDVDAVDTEARDHATALTREAAGEGYDVVVAFGGDGTVNEAANGLRGSSTPLTCLPGGSTNVYARMLGIPNDIVDATEHLLRIADDWQPREVHMAMVNERRFLFSSGLGLDASRRQARRLPPAPEGALRPVLLRVVRVRRVPGQVRRQAAAAGDRDRRRRGRPGRDGAGPEGRALHLLPQAADPRGARRDADRPDAGGRRAAVDAADGHAGRDVPAVLGAREAGAPPAGRRVRGRARGRRAQRRRARGAAARRRRLHRRCRPRRATASTSCRCTWCRRLAV